MEVQTATDQVCHQMRKRRAWKLIPACAFILKLLLFGCLFVLGVFFDIGRGSNQRLFDIDSFYIKETFIIHIFLKNKVTFLIMKLKPGLVLIHADQKLLTHYRVKASEQRLVHQVKCGCRLGGARTF